MKTKYGANLLLSYGVKEAPSARPLCERRIVVFEASGVRAAIRRAKQLGRRAEHHYKNADGRTVEIKFVGLIDVIDLNGTGPEEAYYSMRRTTRPERHVRADADLSVVTSESRPIGSAWWAVPAALVRRRTSKGSGRGA